MKLVGIKYAKGVRVHFFNPRDLELQLGEKVVVDTDQGVMLGEVVVPPKEERRPLFQWSFPEVVRKAGGDDLATWDALQPKEEEAFDTCQECIRELALPMKLVEAAYLFDSSKAIFYFTAEHRVDFRELVRKLAGRLKIRIEMRQIGVRDEAKICGGLGCCGRELCCGTFLKEFELVSIKMAKEQNLPLNPTKISGLCGRLMCCLAFEVEGYRELRKNLPKVGKRIITKKYGEGKVIRQNLLLQTITLELESGGVITISGDDVGS
jgi:cell fate regulator YaaT (PSP1 superfamily)